MDGESSPLIKERGHGANAASAEYRVVKVIAFVAAAAVISYGSHPRVASSMQSELFQREDVEITFSASNEYTATTGFVGAQYPFIEEGKLVEPHKTSTLQATTSSTEELDFVWTVDGEELEGESVEYSFKSVGEYSVTLAASKGSATVATLTDTVVCRYVRREIRGLTDTDREAYFETAAVLYRTDIGEGKLKYGDNFIDVQWFAQLHNSLAGAKECDHFHDGLGFLPQHAAFTLMFEKVLQIVNPSVTVPYWDYTIEAHDVLTQGDIGAWRSSVVWSDDWFGEASPDEYVVTRGRFAMTPIVGKAWNLTDTTNAYGFVRSPWNMNKIKYVTRHNYTYGFTLDDAPGCQQHYDVMQYDQWKDFGTMIQYAPHGTVHAMIGGVWGANFKEKLLNNGYSSVHAANVGLEAFATQKNLWRANQLICPDYCSEDSPALSCKCTCPNIKSWMEAGWTHDILAAVSPLFFTKSYLLNTNKHDISDIILKLMCNDYEEYNPIIGDSLESASPTDISFWPTHPTVDRLYHWKRINGFKNDTWVDNMARSVSFSNVGYCWGHNLDDVTVWKNLFDSDNKPYTNKELWEAFDPTQVAAMPYIYDNFQWSHCEEEGYPLTLL